MLKKMNRFTNPKKTYLASDTIRIGRFSVWYESLFLPKIKKYCTIEFYRLITRQKS